MVRRERQEETKEERTERNARGKEGSTCRKVLREKAERRSSLMLFRVCFFLSLRFFLSFSFLLLLSFFLCLRACRWTFPRRGSKSLADKARNSEGLDPLLQACKSSRPTPALHLSPRRPPQRRRGRDASLLGSLHGDKKGREKEKKTRQNGQKTEEKTVYGWYQVIMCLECMYTGMRKWLVPW